jgi:hypothetical protein
MLYHFERNHYEWLWHYNWHTIKKADVIGYRRERIPLGLIDTLQFKASEGCPGTCSMVFFTGERIVSGTAQKIGQQVLFERGKDNSRLTKNIRDTISFSCGWFSGFEHFA